jgi:hypothetical protein
LVRLLKGAGHRVYLADSLRRPLASASRRHDGFYLLPPFRTARDAAAESLVDLLNRLQIDLVIPTCEEVLYLAQIWRDRPMPAPLFAPGFDRLAEVHDKFRFIQLCHALGLAAPETRLLQDRDAVAALSGEAHGLVFKPVWSRFATMTAIRPTQRQLSRIAPTRGFPWVAQELIQGEELCVYAVAQLGQIRALSAYRGLIRSGLGASVCFAPVQDAALERFVREFVAGTGWTGQISFDLIRMPNGTVWPIECNPRATSGLHFFHDAGRFCGALLGQGEVAPKVTRPQGVRLALWLYGLPQAVRPGGWQRFRRALAEVEEVMDWPDDRLGPLAQLRPFAEIARIAWRQRISLQAAATRDIEWDGPDQSRMS